jgi:ubiquinone/menaquinone biosynthesis C-methylase UbiE
MAIWRDHLLPRIVDKTCALPELAGLRHRTLCGVRGVVVEIGFGSGHNLAHYPAVVDRVLAVEPSMAARRLAEPRVAASGISVEYVGVDGQSLELPDGSVDAAVCTFTLCTIPDATQAVRELGRVLRAGGRLHFLEHGLSPDPKAAAWQHRLTPLQKRFVGGCHFDRPIAELVTSAGFRIVELENTYLPGPKTPGYLYRGVAEPSSDAITSARQTSLKWMSDGCTGGGSA